MINSKNLLKLGAHISIAGGLYKAIIKANQLGCNTIQIFLKNNNRWHSKELTKADILKFKKYKINSSIEPFIAHSGYLSNLASPFKINRKKSIENIIDDIIRCNKININYLIIHPGSYLNSNLETGLKNLICSLKTILKYATNINILLETSAGSGTQVCYKFDQLAKIIDSLDGNIGVCIDTCHIFAAGYNISTKKGFINTIKEIEKTINFNSIKVIHLNDSKHKCGSKLDRHQHIGLGYIGTEAFKQIINFPNFSTLPLIIETPKEKNSQGIDMDIINLSLLKQLYNPK